MSTDEADNDFLEQLEREHQEAKERFAKRKEMSKERREARREEKSEKAELERQRKLREKFYKEHGYKRYVSSRGKVMWLLPEEYEWRTRARKARDQRHSKYRNVGDKAKQEKLLWIGLVLIAMVIGLALLR
ncbi:MAG: hypothetical protein VX899_17455 [Myxococcota bacterium]|nr:hypothetical protein [Myxococcota bacterium]